MKDPFQEAAESAEIFYADANKASEAAKKMSDAGITTGKSFREVADSMRGIGDEVEETANRTTSFLYETDLQLENIMTHWRTLAEPVQLQIESESVNQQLKNTVTYWYDCWREWGGWYKSFAYKNLIEPYKKLRREMFEAQREYDRAFTEAQKRKYIYGEDVDLENFSGEYQTGTGLRGLPSTGLFKGHKGEIVLNPNESMQYRKEGGNSNKKTETINQSNNFYISSTNPKESAREVERTLQQLKIKWGMA